MIAAEALDIGYGTLAVRRGVSFRAESGQCVLLCGANGSGKSTLLRTLAGLTPPLGGRVSVSGTVAMVPTHIPKVRGFSVRDFIRTSLYRESTWAGSLGGEARSGLEGAIGTLGLGDIADRDITEISDGQFQKACMATALTRHAGNILIDEPTAFLDPDNRMMILRTLRDIAHGGGTTVIFSSHDIHDALPYIDLILTMSPYDSLFDGFGGDIVRIFS